MLLRARELGGASIEDETAFLLATVERALGGAREGPADPGDLALGRGRLRRPRRQERSEELAVLERTLAPSLESGLLLLDREGRVLASTRLARPCWALRRRHTRQWPSCWRVRQRCAGCCFRHRRR